MSRNIVFLSKTKIRISKFTYSSLGKPFEKPRKESKCKEAGPKEMLQRFLISLAQVKAGNTSENLLNEIGQIIYSLCWAKEITKREYNNIMNSIKL